MSKRYYYKKQTLVSLRTVIRFASLGASIMAIFFVVYIFFPIISWNIYFAPVFASSDIAAPIPKTTIVNNVSIGSLLATANPLDHIDYSNAQNWFSGAKVGSGLAKIPSYTISIPKLGIKDAMVATGDYDLDKHLVNYGGTAVPPDKGTAVVFGHSTLPQLFDPGNYKTIFANAYKLKVGDSILVDVGNVVYTYTIYNLSVVEPTDMSVFTQSFDDSYLTIVTCTPPGTTWKRLLIKTRLTKL